MAQRSGKAQRGIAAYAHAAEERTNNPPVGLVTPETDRDDGGKAYAHDPHIDPHLSWAGKAEHASFEVPTVSLHVHERIDPRTIVEAVRKRNGTEGQPSLFAAPEKPPASPSSPPSSTASRTRRRSRPWTWRRWRANSAPSASSSRRRETCTT